MPAWRHSDPEVRAAAVRELSDDSLHVLESVARNDTDARVRRAAVKRIDDPELLLAIAKGDTDDGIRSLATARAEDLLVQRALSHPALDECLTALGHLTRSMHRVTVATRAAHAEVRQAALASLTDERALADVARRSGDPEIGQAALERVRDAALLHRIAAGEAAPEVALSALAQIQDPDRILALAEDPQAQKAVRKRARAMLVDVLADDHPTRVAARHDRQLQLCDVVERLIDSRADTNLTLLRDAQREWQGLSAQTPPDVALEERFQRACTAVRDAIERAALHDAEEGRREAAQRQRLDIRRQLCERVDALQGEEAGEGLAAARAAWQEVGPIESTAEVEWQTRFTLAIERCEQRHQRWAVRHTFQSQIEELVREAEKLVELRNPKAAARQRLALEKRWEQLAASPAGVKWLGDERGQQRRFREAGEALAKQEETMRAERQQRESDVRAQVTALCHHLEQLAQADPITPAVAERGLETATEAQEHLRALPAAEREGLRQRLVAARLAVVQRLDQREVSEDWKRWANAEVQQKLIEQAETLLAAGDARAMLRELGRLDQEWKRFAVAPRQQSQALWNRFRRVRRELRRKSSAYLAENLAQKEALCVAVEKLADSTDWSAAAATIRTLQEEWKRIGPVRQQMSAAVFERFRAPANRFFERHREWRLARKAQHTEMLGRMQSLCEAAEALVGSNDWDTAVAEMKRLQQDAERTWGRRPAPRPSKSEALPKSEMLRQRFRTACDQFFDRYRRRGDLALEATLTAAEKVLSDLEALPPALTGPEPMGVSQLAERLTERLGEWTRITGIPPARARAFSQRLQAACDAIEQVCPEGLDANDFDAATNIPQREKLCVRLERLATSLATEIPEPETNDLAMRLKLALAAKTIGGQATPPQQQKLNEAREAAARLQDKWQRLGPLFGPRARALAIRFERAVADIAERTGSRHGAAKR